MWNEVLVRQRQGWHCHTPALPCSSPAALPEPAAVLFLLTSGEQGQL